MREDPLTVEEGMKLGVEDVVKIAAARQVYGTGKARHEIKYLVGDLEEIFGLGTASTRGDEDAIKACEAQVEEARKEHLANPTPPVGPCTNPTTYYEDDGYEYDIAMTIACGLCSGL